MPDPKLGGVPFKEALDHFSNKELLPSRSWDQFIDGEQSRAFTIAGATQVDMLNDFKKSIQEIRARGGTKNDFLKDFNAIAERYGWEYNGDANWRSQIIFETNVRTANAAGRWAQIERRQAAIKARNPNDTLYLQYKVLDHAANRRPEHQAWSDMILPVDHPLWDSIYPPNGFGCACYVVVLTSRALKARGLSVTEKPPELVLTQRVNRGSGEIYPPTPEGVDVGFDHNHGRSAYLPDGAGIVDPRLGTKLAEVTVNSDDFADFVNGKVSGNATVGFLSDSIPELIKAKSNRVLLPDYLIRSQRALALEQPLSDYKKLPELVERGLIIKDGSDTIVFLQVGRAIYKADMSVSDDGQQVLITNYTTTDRSDLQATRKRGTVIREPL